MKRLYQYIILVALLSSCRQEQQQTGLVEHYGVLREIMMELKLEANVDLADLKDKANLYALGALEGLSGEVMVLDGKAYKTSISEQNETITDQNMSGGASLLVTAQVEEWTEVTINTVLHNISELEAQLKELARQNGIDTNRPFPFMLEGEISYLKSHVINAPGASERSHEAFKQSGVVTESNGKESIILGFYSEQHQTVFTHHDSFIHAHALRGNPVYAAHVDEITIQPGPILKLPKNW